MFLQHIVLGVSFLMIQKYEDVFMILQQSVTEITYISRVITAYLSLGVKDMSTIVYVILDQIHIWDMIGIVNFIIVYPLLNMKFIYRIGYSILIMYILCIFVFMIGMHSLSLSNAIVYMRIIGGIIVLMCSMICCFIVSLWRNYERNR